MIKNAEFIALLTANTNKTEYMRTFSKHWPTGAKRVPEEVLFKIGCVVNLIIANLKEGKIWGKCMTKTDCLMVYNFQPLQACNGELYCSIEMLEKPFSERNNTTSLVGHPLQLIINTTTTEVMNNAKGMLLMDMVDEQDLIDDVDLEQPLSFGFYKDYLTVASFLAIGSNENLGEEDIFSGKIDKSELIKNAKAYDCFVEAREALNAVGYKVHLIAELNLPKEGLESAKRLGISKYIIKVIDSLDPKHTTVTETTNKEVKQEANVSEEVERLEMSFKEPTPTTNEQWPMT